MSDDEIVILDTPDRSRQIPNSRILDEDDDIIVEETILGESHVPVPPPLPSHKKPPRPTSSVEHRGPKMYEKIEVSDIDDLLSRIRNATNDLPSTSSSHTHDRQPDLEDDEIIPLAPIDSNAVHTDTDEIGKRRKRNKDEIEAEKVRKEQVREAKKKMREDAKAMKDREKMEKKIQREAQSSVKSKAELYMFCHLGQAVVKAINCLEVEARLLFVERNIDKQLVIDEDIDMRIEWRRKCIEVVQNDDGVDKFEYSVKQHVFAVVLMADAFRELVNSESLEDFVVEQKLRYDVANSHMVIVCYGEHKVPNYKLTNLIFTLHDSYRAQIRVICSSKDLALFLAQMSRGLCHATRHENEQERSELVQVDKGVSPNSLPRADFIMDWWNKMLTAVCRITNAQRRALLAKYPDPFVASRKLEQMGLEAAVRELSEIRCENGRRLGGSMAHKIFAILTDRSGEELVE